MQTTTTQPTTITRFDFNDKMNFLAAKLRFMTDAIQYWDIGSIGIETDTQFGFGLIMEDIIEEMEESVKSLEK